MNKEEIKKTLSFVESIEGITKNIEELVLGSNIPSRRELLNEISLEIIRNSGVLKHSELSGDNGCEIESIETNNIQTIIDNLISNIEKAPSKKIIYLSSFLDRFHDITEQDKNVVLQSIKEEKIEDLKEKLLTLVRVFKLKI
jgi:hypothetical protein